MLIYSGNVDIKLTKEKSQKYPGRKLLTKEWPKKYKYSEIQCISTYEDYIFFENMSIFIHCVLYFHTYILTPPYSLSSYSFYLIIYLLRVS